MLNFFNFSYDSYSLSTLFAVVIMLVLAILCFYASYFEVKNILPISVYQAKISACIHNVATVAACSICASMAQHRATIAQCTHRWSVLNYDHHLVRNGYCDFAGSGGMDGRGAWDSLHHAAYNMGDVVHYCSHCHAIICANCIGF